MIEGGADRRKLATITQLWYSPMISLRAVDLFEGGSTGRFGHPPMTEQGLQLLRSSIDKLVRITCYDGEVIVAKVHFVFDEYEDVVIDLVSTNRESKYEKHDEQPAFAIDIKSIESVETVTDLSGGWPGPQVRR